MTLPDDTTHLNTELGLSRGLPGSLKVWEEGGRIVEMRGSGERACRVRLNSSLGTWSSSGQSGCRTPVSRTKYEFHYSPSAQPDGRRDAPRRFRRDRGPLQSVVEAEFKSVLHN